MATGKKAASKVGKQLRVKKSTEAERSVAVGSCRNATQGDAPQEEVDSAYYQTGLDNPHLPPLARYAASLSFFLHAGKAVVCRDASGLTRLDVLVTTSALSECAGHTP